jgi:Dolichyl-phosphate-mannose-protein mannosyltransferase
MASAPSAELCSKRYSTTFDLLLITMLWIVAIAMTNPFGDFPLNDDWSFGITVSRLLDTGDFRPLGWASMPLITHILWGVLFCIPSGFSFVALRLSTLTMSLAGIGGTYLLVRELRLSRWLAILIALVLAFNPIYYALSNTFMTDAPFTALMVLATLFLARNLRSDSNYSLLLGSGFILAATLNRQLGIAVPLAFLISSILKNGFTPRSILRGAIPAIVSIGGLIVFTQWMTATGRLPALYSAKSDALFQALMRPCVLVACAKNGFTFTLYMGWFLLPVLIFISWSTWSVLSKKARILRALLMLSFLLLSTCGLWYLRGIMPLSSNILNVEGVGPFTLRDSYILQTGSLPSLPTALWVTVTAMGLLGGIMLLTALSTATAKLLPSCWGGKMNSRQTLSTFLLLSAAIYMGPLLVHGFFDRYLIAVVPLMAAGVAAVSVERRAQRHRARKRIFPVIASILVGISLITAVCGTRDYLMWNRIRWTALTELMKSKHAKVDEIDGGFEFNGLHSYTPSYQRRSDKSWWWVKGDQFVMTFGPIPGYSIMQEFHYQQWLPPRQASIMLLQKDGNRSLHSQDDKPANEEESAARSVLPHPL